MLPSTPSFHPHSKLGDLDTEGLVRDITCGKLVVVIGGVGNQVLDVVTDGKGGEADGELTRPTASDGIVAASGGAAVGARGGLAVASVDDVSASRGLRQLVVNSKAPGARRVLAIAVTGQVLDDPVGLTGLEGCGRDGGSDGHGEESLGELHLDGGFAVGGLFCC